MVYESEKIRHKHLKISYAEIEICLSLQKLDEMGFDANKRRQKDKEYRQRKKNEIEALNKRVLEELEEGWKKELHEKEKWWKEEIDFLVERWIERERELTQKVEELHEKERRLQQRCEERVLVVDKRKEDELQYEREQWEKEKATLEQQIGELTKKGTEVAKEVEEELQQLRAEVAEHRRNRLEVWQQWKEWDNDLEFDATKEDGEEEEEKDEMEAEADDRIEERNEYTLEKKAAILDKLVEFAKTAFRRGKQASVHSQVILSLFSCLPKGFVVQSLEVSSRQISLEKKTESYRWSPRNGSKFRSKTVATNASKTKEDKASLRQTDQRRWG
jgi:DNA repair exonuclease SbcCD ATPase subunit